MSEKEYKVEQYDKYFKEMKDTIDKLQKENAELKKENAELKEDITEIEISKDKLAEDIKDYVEKVAELTYKLEIEKIDNKYNKEEEIIIADSDSLNTGRIQAHSLIITDLEKLLGDDE